MTHHINTVVIGGGQAGLSISYYLTQQDQEHVVLEKDRVGESWRSKKWDSFTLVTPNRQMKLPGFEYRGDDPEGFWTRDQVVQYLDDYVGLFNPPLRLGVEVASVEKNCAGDGLIVETDAGRIEASNVVVATGTFQQPAVPNFSQRISPGISQTHSSRYRNPGDLPSGAVLVVGSGQSGCQITEELYKNVRAVYLCTSGVGRAPRRYRGKDFTVWLEKMGVIDKTVEDLDSPAGRFVPNPQVSGKNGGHTLNLHQFALDGVTLLGSLEGADGSTIFLADNLKENLHKADQFAGELKKNVDRFVRINGLELPEDRQQELRAGYESEVFTEMDLESSGIKTMIWATGYDFDYSLVHLPIWDEFGYPIHERGVTEQPGLYFLGLHWLHTIKSGLFYGVGDDAAHIAQHIAGRN